jgi:Mn-dependent DtxR family transcriptional regulator
VNVNDRVGTVAAHTDFTTEEARRVGEQLGIDWDSARFDVEQFRRGMDVELEHGLHELATNVTDDDPVVTGRSPSPI